MTTHLDYASNLEHGDRTTRADHPGRWVGGAIGAGLSLMVAWIGLAIDRPTDQPGVGGLFGIGLMGVPVGFVLGRQFLPLARERGWARALTVGFGIGWLAPPIGATVVVLSPLIVPAQGAALGIGSNPSLALLIWPIALVYSYVAIVVTLPVGLAWGVAVRLVPDRVFTALRVSAPFDRLGVRHAVLALAAALIVIGLAR
jgi:hypothetical protein